MATHVRMTLLEDLKRAAWSRTSPVGHHANAWEFRKDRLGNMVRYADYGNRKSPFGWELDFIEPRAVGGSSDPSNIQALHWRATAARSDNVPAALVASPAAPRIAA
jgi:hypothetical protein